MLLNSFEKKHYVEFFRCVSDKMIRRNKVPIAQAGQGFFRCWITWFNLNFGMFKSSTVSERASFWLGHVAFSLENVYGFLFQSFFFHFSFIKFNFSSRDARYTIVFFIFIPSLLTNSILLFLVIYFYFLFVFQCPQTF